MFQPRKKSHFTQIGNPRKEMCKKIEMISGSILFFNFWGGLIRDQSLFQQIALISVIDDIPKLFNSHGEWKQIYKMVAKEKHQFNPIQVAVVTLFIFTLDFLSDAGHVLSGNRTQRRFLKNRIDAGIALFVGSFLIPWAFAFKMFDKGETSYLLIILVTLLGTMTMGLLSDQITLLLFRMPRNEKLERAFHKLEIDSKLSNAEINERFKAKLMEAVFKQDISLETKLKWNMLVVKDLK